MLWYNYNMSSPCMIRMSSSEHHTGTVHHSLVPRLLGGGEKRAWYLLFAHVHNYPLLNTCSGKSWRGTRILIHVIGYLRLISEVPSRWRELEGAGERRRTNDQNASIVGQKVCGQCSGKYTFCRHSYTDSTQ